MPLEEMAQRAPGRPIPIVYLAFDRRPWRVKNEQVSPEASRRVE